MGIGSPIFTGAEQVQRQDPHLNVESRFKPSVRSLLVFQGILQNQLLSAHKKGA